VGGETLGRGQEEELPAGLFPSWWCRTKIGRRAKIRTRKKRTSKDGLQGFVMRMRPRRQEYEKLLSKASIRFVPVSYRRLDPSGLAFFKDIGAVLQHRLFADAE